MRTISANALAKIASQYGSEPITILDISWVDGEITQYADRNIGTISGKILEIDNLDAVININQASSSQSLTVKLIDTDNSIKDLMDIYDIHLRDVWVYQYFEELDLTDRFLLFKGKINSPITWNEGDRTVTFTVLSQLEDKEIGFSPEEGQFTNLSSELVGKPWPMCFGTTIQSKAVRLTDRYSGTTATGLSIPDRNLLVMSGLNYILSRYPTYAFTSINKNPHYKKYLELRNTYYKQVAAGPSLWVTIFNGSSFPKGNITLEINGNYFPGKFIGDTFHLSRSVLSCAGKIYPSLEANYGRNSSGNFKILTGQILGEPCGYTFIAPGSSVKLYSLEPQKYVVSIVPGTVLKVTTWCTKNGEQFLQDVPEDLYSVSTENFGNISAVVITMHDALSKYKNMDWGDDIYVTFKSDIGPNTADILEYLIEEYSDFTADPVSFAHVKSKIENYPSDFTIYDRPNIVNILQDISWQARCSIYLRNGVFYLQYLPEIQPSVVTITKDDILQDTLELYYTNTETLVTKMDTSWKKSGMQETPFRAINRNNVARYGVHDKQVNMFIYNFIDAVLKSTSYWMILYSNTWKKIKFQTPLHLLKVETLDYITIDLPDIVSNSPVLCKVEKASYNSDNRSIEFECWCPVKAGSMVEYDFAYPSDIPSTLLYPTDQEYIEEKYMDAKYLWEEPIDASDWTVGKLSGKASLGGYNREVNDPYNFGQREELDNSEYSKDNKSDTDRRDSSRGAVKPSDIGDIHPGDINITETPQLSSSTPGPDSPTSGNPILVDIDGDCGGGGGKWGNMNEPGDDPEESGEEERNQEELPKPSELDPEEYPCMHGVRVSWLVPVVTVKQAGQWPSSSPGATGEAVAGNLIWKYEQYVFTTLEDANAFVATIQSLIDDFVATVGENAPFRVGGYAIPGGGATGCESNPDPIAYTGGNSDSINDSSYTLTQEV